MTPKLCVIGDPIAQSLSPVIQTAMLNALGLAGSYGRELVRREELPRFVEWVRAGEFTGFNATMPHKLDLPELLDEVDRGAQLAGSVNTVVRREDGALVGHSTDGAGFVEALRGLGVDPKGAAITLLGAGGAARSLAAALSQAGAARLTVCARRSPPAQAVCAAAHQAGGAEAVEAGFSPTSLRGACKSAQVLVNCTSLGMEGQGQFENFGLLEALPADAAVCDLVYHPAETELLRLARGGGRKAMNGLPLLVWQGVLALELFLGGEKRDRERMAKAAFEALPEL